METNEKWELVDDDAAENKSKFAATPLSDIEIDSREKSVDTGPPIPDPLWPIGAMPMHLTAQEINTPSIVAPYMQDENGVVWKCEKCGATLGKSLSDPRYCFVCAENLSVAIEASKKTAGSWVEEAQELGIELFERQPEETEKEWRIWSLYRAHYPMKMPTMSELAVEAGSTVATVVRTSTKWKFNLRLVAWARYADAAMQEKRITHIKQMNEKHLRMAQKITEKLETAIDCIVPEMLKPSEITSLFKISTELEHRIATAAEETVQNDSVDKKSKQSTGTRTEDLSEVAKILMDVGALDGKILGIEQTTTTRVVAKEDKS